MTSTSERVAGAGALLLAAFSLASSGPAAAGNPASCRHFHFIERTDIGTRAQLPPGGTPPPQDLCIPHGYLVPPLAPLPRIYFKEWDGLADTTTDLAITAKWPSMESVWDKPRPDRKEYDPVTHGNLLNIWFAMSTSYPSVDFRFNVEKRLLNATRPGAPQFGLRHLVPDPSTPRPEGELYFTPDQVHSSFIVCDTPLVARSPGCKETFEYLGYLITVQYSVVYFPMWEEIQEKTKLLISRFLPEEK